MSTFEIILEALHAPSTIRELSEGLGIDVAVVRSAIVVLSHDGTIEIMGKQKPKGGRGKPSNIYVRMNVHSAEL